MNRAEAFWRLHRDNPREGPGCEDDVVWAVERAGVSPGARVLDAGCGPGADIPALLAAIPDCHITAVDTHADFIERVIDAHSGPRVDARQSSMADVVGPFDFIWSAGAVYSVGLEIALAKWRQALSPGGSVAFTEPCYLTDAPSDAAKAFWAGDGDIRTVPEIEAAITVSGYEIVVSRPLADEAWEAYYRPLDAHIAALRETDNPALQSVLDEAEAEAAGWRAHRDEVGYLLSIVRPA